MSNAPAFTALQVMQDAPVIPVIVLNDVAHAAPARSNCSLTDWPLSGPC